MTVKDIFDLRKQGRIEEAYNAIRPMYAQHKGHYTTLCMYWTGSDMLRLRLKEGNTAEAARILEALLRMLPNVDDKDGRAHSSLLHNAVALGKASADYDTLRFVSRYGAEQISEYDWRDAVITAPNGRNVPVPSAAHRLLAQAFRQLQQQPTIDNALIVMPLLHEAVKRTPHDKHCLQYMAVIYDIMGETSKAADIRRRLTNTRHDGMSK